MANATNVTCCQNMGGSRLTVIPFVNRAFQKKELFDISLEDAFGCGNLSIKRVISPRDHGVHKTMVLRLIVSLK